MNATEDMDNIIVISRYSELTPEIMIRLLKSGLNDFEFGYYKNEKIEVPTSNDLMGFMTSFAKYISAESKTIKLSDLESGSYEQHLSEVEKDYYLKAMALIHEYISKVEEKKYSVGEIRFANRGLEALMWHCYDVSSKTNIDDLPFDEFLLKDNLNDAILRMHDNVVDLVKKANCEEVWIHTDWYSKTDLLKMWGYTLLTDPEDIHDENSAFPFYSKRELRMFEKIMGREFEEFDSLLR